MTVFLILVAIGVLAGAGFVLARRRVLAAAGGNPRVLHSRPGYYGWHAALATAVPALLVLALWLVVQPLVIERQVSGLFPEGRFADDTARLLTMDEVRRVAQGLARAEAQGVLVRGAADGPLPEAGRTRAILARVGVPLGAEVTPEVLAAAQHYRDLSAAGATGRAAATLLVALLGLGYALAVTQPAFRARNRVEAMLLVLLAAASTLAILTTVAIVLSMVTESLRFFSMYPAADFFFGLTWSPDFRGDSQLGLLPLLWGTLYISLVSMIVAVPAGLFTAIYLAEYANPRVRGVVKPAIEMLAGIPTVVFGLFALVTVGPFLRDWFAQPMGLGNSGSSVMTAGLVIGILNIPFISSLADDIINAVPQTLRDGSYALGATRSETIRQVVLPAALPGIVGAVLLAASRAIGETMIVTMGAGAAARLDLNPFEAMTTVTVKIVSQLTGDTEFNSPETLVAFALGLTLFVMTLALNILALWIVRRFREQYE
jgi:phosphate transport system permease protein